MVWSVWSQDSKIDCISKMNRWNELFFFCMLVQIQEAATSHFPDFLVGVAKNGRDHLVHEGLELIFRMLTVMQ